MRKIILLLLICNSAWAQQTTQKEYSFEDFSLKVGVEEQEKYYNDMLQHLSPAKATDSATNDYRGELAFSWLAKGNIERYKYYKSGNPKFTARQFLYLCNALEHLFDDKKQYAAVEQITSDILNDIEKHILVDPIGRTGVLMELNAAANARLGNVNLAKEMIMRPSVAKDNSRELKYFRDSKSNYLNRYAIVMSAAGQDQVAFDILTKAFKEADSNPNMVATFREVYTKLKGADNGFEAYIKSLQDEAYRKYFKEVEKMYIASAKTMLEGSLPDPNRSGKMVTFFRAKKPVKDLSMLNLDNNAVNLGDYKGKILVLDFWTTLCTPCVAAFRGFERVVADYKKDSLQLFVVNLFEDQATVKSYVAKKGISLDVLRDEDNVAYDVQGTPTKIVFDPMGNIRFYGVGYAGSTDREYYKLKSMVEIIKARAVIAANARK
ncbi:TlpA family protein disulfide reductase [Chitinophaga sp. Ak27]|uniref:TlpA family protein disulfide reductase n=1 Tax=Chitinophaga sp. Ak27 TaxID=2726116 RepID=UPI00145E0C25|nr:TlpA disulfide reductase family protein [Chitinophaga sp. Ak27]NLU95683.1 TlpA family protein disulfide reductase [Chitinophaga sp. Ak27]